MKDLKTKLSKEWTNPKAKNLKKIDKRVARDYDVINTTQDAINKKKTADKELKLNTMKTIKIENVKNNSILQRLFSKKDKTLKEKALNKLNVKRKNQKKLSKK